MSITAEAVKRLREATGAGIMDCKKALEESNGDFDKAVEILRKRGHKMAAARQERTAKEGAVFAATKKDTWTPPAFSLRNRLRGSQRRFSGLWQSPRTIRPGEGHPFQR
jgi:hypothetical protein